MGQVAIIDRPAQAPSFTLSDMERIATSIARGGMFGSKDPHAVLTLCMLAQAEGQHPAVVFRDYDIIQGKPAKKAEAMLRDFISSGGRVTWNRLDDECADATFSHPMGGEVTINWTMARAQKAQLGGKEMWKKYPRQMLRSRVVSEGVRTVCPMATSGLYVPEEVRDFAPDSSTIDTPATPQPQRARDLKAIDKPDPARAKAEEWLNGYLADPADTPANQRALAKLAKDHPDLHERAIAISPTTGGLEAVEADAPQQEAEVVDASESADTANGEVPTLAQALAEIAACELAMDVNTKAGALIEFFDGAEADQIRSAAIDRIAALKAGQ